MVVVGQGDPQVMGAGTYRFQQMVFRGIGVDIGRLAVQVELPMTFPRHRRRADGRGVPKEPGNFYGDPDGISGDAGLVLGTISLMAGAATAAGPAGSESPELLQAVDAKDSKSKMPIKGVRRWGSSLV